MINAKHDVEIGGVPFRLAEDAEGDHYVHSHQPLRPPNSVVVQGSTSQRFQARPDILIWEIDDWSGGEGQDKYDSSNANRHWRLTGINPFEFPGSLKPGYYIEETTDELDAVYTEKGIPVRIGQYLGFVDFINGKLEAWDNSNQRWGVLSVTVNADNSLYYQVGSDLTYAYYYDSTNEKLYKSTLGGTETELWNSFPSEANGPYLTAYGSYVYMAYGDLIYELSKGASASAVSSTEEIYTLPGDVYVRYGSVFAVANGKVYFLYAAYRDAESIVYEITPTTAAASATVVEFARFPGLFANNIWEHDNRLYVSGVIKESNTVLYLNTDGTFGVVGTPRRYEDTSHSSIKHDNIVGNRESSSIFEHAIALGRLSADTEEAALVVFDAVSGGHAVLAYDDNREWSTVRAGPVLYRGDWYWVATYFDGLLYRTLRARRDKLSPVGTAYTPWQDFEYAGKKVLGSIHLSTKPLPADWEISLSYLTDGDETTETLIGTYDTEGGSGTDFTISTNTTPVSFRTLRIKTTFNYTGVGIPPGTPNSDTCPTILRIDVHAQVVKQQILFELLLDLSDDLSGGSNSWSGEKKFTELETLSHNESVVEFKDGYPYKNSGEFDSYDVVIDANDITMTHPSEGYCRVRLLEVV